MRHSELRGAVLNRESMSETTKKIMTDVVDAVAVAPAPPLTRDMIARAAKAMRDEEIADAVAPLPADFSWAPKPPPIERSWGLVLAIVLMIGAVSVAIGLFLFALSLAGIIQ